VSFAPTLTDGGSDGREFLVTGQGAWACQRGVRWDDWLLLRTYHDGWKDFDAVELYDLAEDPHETEDLARERTDVVRAGLAYLQTWRGETGLDAAVGRNGGNPDAPRGLVDPLLEEVREGGPTYLRGNLTAYAERLRATDREAHAEYIEDHDGIVPEGAAEYL